MPSSRFVRPENPTSAVVLQARDLEILLAVYVHRYVRADHLHRLLFAEVSLRVCQARLRKLWEHRLLERHFTPFGWDGVRKPPSGANAPTYALSERGATVVSEVVDDPAAEIPHGFGESALGPVILDHHLVTTDLLVALEIVCRDHADLQVESVLSEAALWPRVYAWKAASRENESILVPDGAFTLSSRGGGKTFAFYLEVVRADVKGGNRRLLDKLARYAELHRAGTLRQVYGDVPLRAVLIVTTSEERAEHFRVLADNLPHGRRLFWFGAYEAPEQDGRRVPSFTAEDVLARRWRSAEGEAHSLLDVASVPVGGLLETSPT